MFRCTRGIAPTLGCAYIYKCSVPPDFPVDMNLRSAVRSFDTQGAIVLTRTRLVGPARIADVFAAFRNPEIKRDVIAFIVTVERYKLHHSRKVSATLWLLQMFNICVIQ